jgi:hypothetical protein
MSKPATRQQMLRQVFAAVFGGPTPSDISFLDDEGYRILTINTDSLEDATAITAAMPLSDWVERGQPYPLTGPTEFWSGSFCGELLGWDVNVKFHAPFTGDYVARWDAKDGFKRYGMLRPAEPEQVTANA